MTGAGGHDVASTGEFAGSVALVTGAGRGIGAAVARLLAERGARVAATDRDPEGVRELAGAAPRITGFALDVTAPAAVDAAVARVEEELGPLTAAVNVAGVLPETRPVTELTDEEWHFAFGVNTHGVLHVSRAAARVMAPRRGGSILTVASNAAGIPRSGMAAYAASKAAAAMFSKSLGLELAPLGIRCNTVCPGSTDSAMQRSMWTGDPGSARQRVIDGDPAAYRTGIPLGRLAEPEDIAEAVAFLLSERARHITLHDLYVDGGATLRA